MIAVTSRDLRSEIATGRFHVGLFGRLAAVEIAVPPLRDRREDIPYLTAAFVRECAHHLHKSFDGLTPLAERRLLNARWDGNIRELRNLIERACMLADSRLIAERELAGVATANEDPAASRAEKGGSLLAIRSTLSTEPGPTPLEYREREQIVDTLRQLGGNRMAAAKALGISRRALYRRLARHHISHPAPRHRARRAPALRTT